jgi:hypothetical protein
VSRAPRWGVLRAARRHVGLALLAVAALACARDAAPPLELRLGDAQATRFVPLTALARYVELAGRGDQLRLVFASYEQGCDRFVPPGDGAVHVQVTVQAPAGAPLETGAYPASGDLADFEGGQRGALAYVRLRDGGRALPGGGKVELERLDLRLHGEVVGELALSDGSAGQPERHHLRGRFRARLCHVALDRARRQKAPPPAAATRLPAP